MTFTLYNIVRFDLWVINSRNYPGYGLSQWEATLHCNVVFHWLSHIQSVPWTGLLNIDIHVNLLCADNGWLITYQYVLAMCYDWWHFRCCTEFHLFHCLYILSGIHVTLLCNPYDDFRYSICINVVDMCSQFHNLTCLFWFLFIMQDS